MAKELDIKDMSAYDIVMAMPPEDLEALQCLQTNPQLFWNIVGQHRAEEKHQSSYLAVATVYEGNFAIQSTRDWNKRHPD